MNYFDYLQYSNNLKESNRTLLRAYFSSGEALIVKNRDDSIYELPTNYSLEEVCYFVANYSNFVAPNDTLLFFDYYDNTADFHYLIFTTKIDFIDFTWGDYMWVDGETTSDFQNGTYGDLLSATNYDVTNYNSILGSTTPTYGSFTFDESTTEQNPYHLIFDFNKVKDLQTLVARGENMSFYQEVLVVETNGRISQHDTTTRTNINTGNYISGIRNESYNTGYSNGYSAGWVNGQQYGYQQGQNSVISNETATAFSYVSQAFNAVGGILELEVLPHVNLGLCFSIPLILILIMTIFKLVRK